MSLSLSHVPTGGRDTDSLLSRGHVGSECPEAWGNWWLACMGPKADAMWLLVAMPDHRIQHLSQKLIGLKMGI